MLYVAIYCIHILQSLEMALTHISPLTHWYRIGTLYFPIGRCVAWNLYP